MPNRESKTALKSKLPPATRYLVKPGDYVRVYRESSKKWEGPFKVKRVSSKLVSVTDGNKVKTFSITAVLPIPSNEYDPDLEEFNHDLGEDSV